MSSLTKFIDNVELFLLKPLMMLLLAMGMLLFFWGLAQFILGAGNDENRTTGKKHMLWGIIGMFIMATAQQIVNWLTI